MDLFRLWQILHIFIAFHRIQGLLSSTMGRRSWFQNFLGAVTAFSLRPSNVEALNINPQSITTPMTQIQTPSPELKSVAYKSLSVPIPEYGVTFPVACWFPTDDGAVADKAARAPQVITYPHRISVKRIGQMLAGWNFIPGFASRNFALKPTLLKVANGQDLPLPTSAPVVLLAHGYLGSRFDMSHLAEALAQDGFVCLSAEYPESLAASYDRMEGLDRTKITQRMLQTMKNDWKIQPTSYGIVGHSLGCGTAVQTGDDSWTRVLVAGFPGRLPGKNVLFISSTNDGAVSMSRMGGRMAVPRDLTTLDEKTMMSMDKLPHRAALILDRPDAPNHISFLSEGVNDAMISLLSPLLPMAQAMSIPVLDFDRYQVSRDSRPTAELLHPLIRRYMVQHMIENREEIRKSARLIL
jgi:hypothetical protein